MATSEPWVQLGRDLATSRRLINDESREVYLARRQKSRLGFVVLTLAGALPGYIQSVAVAPAVRGEGIGSLLLAHAEARIFAVSPNVFLCVSSFNPRARRLYERAGYQLIGAMPDYLVRGHSELLFRKSRGPWSEFAVQHPNER